MLEVIHQYCSLKEYKKRGDWDAPPKRGQLAKLQKQEKLRDSHHWKKKIFVKLINIQRFVRIMQKEDKKFEGLMKESMNFGNSPRKRADSFNKVYNEYIKIDKEGKKWNEFRVKLRKKFANKLTQNQRKEYALTRNKLKKSYFEIKRSVHKSRKSMFPVELSYEASFSVIRKVLKKGDKALDIGYGDFPIFVDLLNKKGYRAYGIEPFAKQFDEEKTFKCKIENLPRKLEELKFNLILANMVYSVNYTSYFSKKFKWESKHKKELITKFFELLEHKGFLILIDDVGSIFSKRDLEKHFQIFLFEKDTEVINFDTNKIEDFVRITLLQRK